MATCKVLLSVDCIFDVVFACVVELYPELAHSVVSNGYLKRDHNTLSLLDKGIDDDLIAERFNSRDVKLLHSARASTFLTSLAKEIVYRSNLDEAHPDYMKFSITLNTYPYEFTKVETKELFTILKTKLNPSPVFKVHFSVDKMTPSLLKANYDRFVIYNFDEWITKHGDSLNDVPISEVVCTAPVILLKEHTNVTDIDQIINTSRRAFLAGKILYLDLLTLNNFSIAPLEPEISDETDMV